MERKHFDIAIIDKVLETFTPFQRREWYIKMKMSERQKTFDEIGKRPRITRQSLSQAVGGGRSWSPRIIKALESHLSVDLTPFLTEKEADKLRRSKSHH